MTDAFLPLIELSDSPRIVNVSSGMGKLKNEWAVSVFSDVESLNEEKIEQVLDQFLRDFKQEGAKGPVKLALLSDGSNW
ncbi:(+)-neomenthol dehydrogenase [Linum perenne]